MSHTIRGAIEVRIDNDRDLAIDFLVWAVRTGTLAIVDTMHADAVFGGVRACYHKEHEEAIEKFFAEHG
jgi:hypothetical protein